MLVGNWGVIAIFTVDSDRVFTFRDVRRSVSARWTDHQILFEKARSEFLGPDVQELSMEVVLDAQLGVHPHIIMENLRRACEDGRTEYLYMGGEKLGKHRWYLKSLDATLDRQFHDGRPLRETLQLTFREYYQTQ